MEYERQLLFAGPVYSADQGGARRLLPAPGGVGQTRLPGETGVFEVLPRSQAGLVRCFCPLPPGAAWVFCSNTAFTQFQNITYTFPLLLA